MDATVEEIGVVVVGALGAAGYLDSTIGQYQKAIKAARLVRTVDYLKPDEYERI